MEIERRASFRTRTLTGPIDRQKKGTCWALKFRTNQARPAFKMGALARWLQVLIEPADRAFDHVAAMRWITEFVALMGINDELGGHTKRLERVPELVRLRRRALSVAITYDH